jgi:hypothetical protein
MDRDHGSRFLFGTSIGVVAAVASAALADDPINRQPGPLEYGYRPAEGEICLVTPPSFVWLLQPGAKTYDVQVSGAEAFSDAGTTIFPGILNNVFTPDQCRERIPKKHPRLMLRPEDVGPLRRRIADEPLLGGIFAEIRKQSVPSGSGRWRQLTYKKNDHKFIVL